MLPDIARRALGPGAAAAAMAPLPAPPVVAEPHPGKPAPRWPGTSRTSAPAAPRTEPHILISGLACPYFPGPMAYGSEVYDPEERRVLRFARGCFRDCLTDGAVELRITHDPPALARVADGSLTLWESSTGLEFQATISMERFGNQLCDGLLDA